MTILVVSHTYISNINRDKWKKLAALYPTSRVVVVIPKRWPTTLFSHEINEKELATENTPKLTFVPLDAYFYGNEVRYFYAPTQLYTIIKTHKPSILHVEQGANALSYFQCIITARVAGLRPKCIFFTWVNWDTPPTLSHRLFWQYIQTYNLSHSHGAIVGNAQAKKLLEEKGFTMPIAVLPQLGIDPDLFSPASQSCHVLLARSHPSTSSGRAAGIKIKPLVVSLSNHSGGRFQKKLASQRHTITFVGRLVPEKGIYNLLEAFSRLKHHHATWQLRFIGDGPERPNLLARIQCAPDQVIIYTPTMPHDKVRDELRSSDIFVLPSFDTPTWKEQFGHVIIEAMACGVPVMASTGGAIPDVVGDVGSLFNQYDVADLTRQLDQLMNNREQRAAYACQGRSRIEQYFTHTAIAHATYRFWHKMVTST